MECDTILRYTDGSSIALGCRERPHIVIGPNGNAVALTNGAAPVTCHTAGGDDRSFTSLQLVRTLQQRDESSTPHRQ